MPRLYLKLLLALLLGAPLLLLVHAYTYSLFGHRVRVRYREKKILVEAPRHEYTITITGPRGWVLEARTNYLQDPYI